MGFDPVPWFVGGGAEHSPEVARNLAFNATGGAEGITQAADLKVVPLSIPGTSVRVLTGSCSILSRAAGGSQQVYTGRMVSEQVVPISSTGSDAGRSDLIVARVEDPFMAGEPWSAPVDPKTGPYIFIRVIPNVPAGTVRLQDVDGYSGQSAIALARIDIPANTGTIADQMIVPLRKIARPRREPNLFHTVPTASEKLTSAAFAHWATQATRNVFVPDWATTAHIRAEMGAVQSNPGGVWGRLRARVGNVGGANVLSREVGYDINTPAANGVDRHTFLFADVLDVSSMRGTTVPFGVEGKKDGGDATIEVNSLSSIVYSIEFIESPI